MYIRRVIMRVAMHHIGMVYYRVGMVYYRVGMVYYRVGMVCYRVGIACYSNHHTGSSAEARPHVGSHAMLDLQCVV